jgi:serine/threonine protein kinase
VRPAGADSKPPGTLLLGRFRLAGFLAAGGQADVHVAIDEQTQARRAVKIARAADPAAQARLRLEADVLSRVSSPHVVPYVASGDETEAGGFCLVEQLVPGAPLGMLLPAGRPVPLEQAQAILVQVAAGLEALHAVGFIMRDLTPAQILVERVGGGLRCVLVDLGLTRPLDGLSELTDPRMAAGTPGWVAPELIAGGQATPAADSYSLAVLAYRLLTGSAPFEAARPEAVLALQMAEEAAPLVPVWPGLRGAAAAEVAGFFRRCLSADPAVRPASPGAFVAALAGLLEGAVVAAARPGRGLFARATRLVPWVVLAAAAVAAAVVLIRKLVAGV